jgi:hypothetical protein
MSLPVVPIDPIIEVRDESTAPTVSLTRNFTGHLIEHQSLKTKENFMSAPSRRPEIRRRRTRAEKIAKLRKRLNAKLHRAGLVSPGNPLVKSA